MRPIIGPPPSSGWTTRLTWLENPDAMIPTVERLPNESPLEAERRQRKQKLCAAYRLFARFGFDEGIAGHISARDPEHDGRFWLAPLGRYFGKLRVSDLVCVDHDGKVVVGEGPINSAAFAIHSEVHKARPDVTAAAHAHSPAGKTFSSLPRLLSP